MNKRVKNILVIIFFFFLICVIIVIGIYSQKTTSINSKANVPTYKTVRETTFYYNNNGVLYKTFNDSTGVTTYFDQLGRVIRTSGNKKNLPKLTPISN